jgi:hypothetical protein
MPNYSSVLQQLRFEKESLEKLIGEKSKELQRINAAIDGLIGPVPRNSRFNWTDAALDCINSHGIFLQTVDILERVFNGTHELEDEKRKRNAIVSLSVTLNNLCNKGLLRKLVVHGVKGHFYGLPEWFGENGHIKPAHIANLMAKYGKVNEPVKWDLAMMLAAGLIG